MTRTVRVQAMRQPCEEGQREGPSVFVEGLDHVDGYVLLLRYCELVLPVFRVLRGAGDVFDESLLVAERAS